MRKSIDRIWYVFFTLLLLPLFLYFSFESTIRMFNRIGIYHTFTLTNAHTLTNTHKYTHIHFIRWDIYVLQFFICDFSCKHMRTMDTCVCKQYKREFKSFFTFSSTNCRNSNFTGFLLIDFIIGKLRMVFHCVFLCIDKLTTIKCIH